MCTVALEEYEVTTRDLGELPPIPVKIMMNVGNPELAFDFAQLPNEGVGLARVEFIINNIIGIHPKAILEVDRLPASKREEIERRARGYADPVSFFTDKLGGRRGDHCRRFLAEAGDRASVGLQIERIPQAAGGDLTSRRKKTRCSASAAPRVISRSPSRIVSRWNARPCAPCAKCWATPTCS